MNNTTILNIQFICKYIVSFGIIFYNKGLIKIDQRYQIVPVFNAFFQYLNQSSNSTEAKIQLLLEVSNNSDFYQNNLNKGNLYKENFFKKNIYNENFVKTNLNKENLIQDNFYNKENAPCNLKHPNETYQCIINVTLFSHYGGIIGYLSKILNKTENKSILAFRKILLLDLIHNYMINDICSSVNTTVKFTSLTIEKILEYIWPLFIHLHATRESFNDAQKKGSRYKRSYDNNDDGIGFIVVDDGNFILVDDDENCIVVDDNDENYSLEEDYIDYLKSDENDPRSSKIPEIEEETNSFSDNSKNSVLSANSEWESILDVLYENTDYNFDNILKEFRDNGIIMARKNEDNFKMFKLEANNLAIQQINREWLTSPIKLWHSQATNRWIFEYFQNYVGGFSFNDITLLKKIESNQLPWTTWRPFDFDTPSVYKLYYHITIGSHYGFVNLESTKNFKNIIITFPDVRFNVVATEIYKESRNLIIYMVNNYLAKEEWESNRIKELSILNTTQRGKNKRMQSIEKAANIITANVPMYTFEMSVDLLKNYILRLEESESPMPTYNEFAIDFFNNLEVHDVYNSFKIPRHKLIDDVLFDENLNYLTSYNDFETRIKKVHPLFEKSLNKTYNRYQQFHQLKRSFRLEDYSLLRETFRNENKNFRATMFKRVKFALYRLALRQSEEEWTNYNNTFYRAKYAGNTNALYRRLQTEPSYTFRGLVEFSSSYSDERNRFPISNGTRGDYEWMEIEFENQVGLVNIDRLFNENYMGKYVIPPPRILPVKYYGFEHLDNKNVLVIKMVDTESKERKILDLVYKLYEILEGFPELSEYYS